MIIIIRSYLMKSKRLLKLTTELEKNKRHRSSNIASKPPIFWKDKDIVKKQLKIWTKKVQQISFKILMKLSFN